MLGVLGSLRGAARCMRVAGTGHAGSGLALHRLSPVLGARYHRKVADSGEQISFHFKLRDGSRKTVSVPVGTTVLEAAHANEVDLEGACEASLACSTCHVILPQDLYNDYEEPCEKEEDLLDMCPCLSPTSRLGCQVIVDEKLRDQEVTLPPMTLNFYVDGHVPTPH
eukprot:TRINITY_DN18290_c0_g1_i1.p1 TRINITY_DN18290_c0_g1~~TRINITY_DN18290_c0_g1_i1.p1  ORF type:complete len:167 (+),score=35.86 TRINITY_DN18290_c0_g1_i1:85-585(+)